jgi:hypothetical protein
MYVCMYVCMYTCAHKAAADGPISGPLKYYEVNNVVQLSLINNQRIIQFFFFIWQPGKQFSWCWWCWIVFGISSVPSDHNRWSAGHLGGPSNSVLSCFSMVVCLISWKWQLISGMHLGLWIGAVIVMGIRFPYQYRALFAGWIPVTKPACPNFHSAHKFSKYVFPRILKESKQNTGLCIYNWKLGGSWLKRWHFWIVSGNFLLAGHGSRAV